jgi:hypothetical protein
VRLLLLRRAQVAAFSSTDWEYLYTELRTQACPLHRQSSVLRLPPPLPLPL